jgi:hypothetical protein
LQINHFHFSNRYKIAFSYFSRTPKFILFLFAGESLPRSEQDSGPERPTGVEGHAFQPALVEEVHVGEEQSTVGRDAEDEARQMQSRVDGAAVTDAGHQESDVGKDGEGKPSEDENLSGESAPTPRGGNQGYVSQHGGAQRDGGRCRRGVAGRKAHVRVQTKQQEGNRIFGKYDDGDKSAIARVRRAEESRDRKQQGRDEHVRERGEPECRSKNMPAQANIGGILCWARWDVCGHGSNRADYTAGKILENFCFYPGYSRDQIFDRCREEAVTLSTGQWRGDVGLAAWLLLLVNGGEAQNLDSRPIATLYCPVEI